MPVVSPYHVMINNGNQILKFDSLLIVEAQKTFLSVPCGGDPDLSG